MDWSVIAFTLFRYAEANKKSVVNVEEFVRFVFRELWAKHGVALCSSREELLEVLKYLQDLGLIELTGDEIRLKDYEGLRKISDFASKTRFRELSALYNELISRIERAVTQT